MENENLLILSKTKSIMSLTDKLINSSNDSWMHKLWDWADEHKISNYTIPRDYHRLVSLQNLDLSDQYLASLPQEITLLSNLKKLDLTMNKGLVLSKNQIEWIFQLEVNFCSINMDNGLLYRTSSSEEKMDTWIIKLWEWSVGHDMDNAFDMCCEAINLPLNEKALLELTELNLVGCYTHVPQEITNLINLRELDLVCYGESLEDTKGNHICYSIIEPLENIGKLINLTRINLSECELSELPESIINLTNLKLLDLRMNPGLILTEKQKEWITNLQKNGCAVMINDLILDHALEYKNKISNICKPTISSDQNKIIEFEDGIEAWIDTDTDLMWEVKNKNNVEEIYTKTSEYVEHECETWEGKFKGNNAKDYINYLNTIKYAGYHDWRMPMIYELETLSAAHDFNLKVNYDFILPPAGNHFAIKLPLIKNTLNWYWAENIAPFDDYSDYVHFYCTSMYSTVHTIRKALRCVRGRLKIEYISCRSTKNVSFSRDE